MRLPAILGSVILWSGFLSANAYRGDNSRLTLDKSRDRTSSLIRSGELKIQIAPDPTTRDGEVHFPVTGTYDVDAVMAGRQNGSLNLTIQEKFFLPEFMAELKAKKQIQLTKFRLTYLETVPSVQAKGRTYSDCHKLLIDNIDFGLTSEPATELFTALIIRPMAEQLNESLDAQGDIQNGKATMFFCKDVPAGGVTKVDMSGTVRGISVRLGFDYHP